MRDVCVCGHLEVPTHPDGGGCRVKTCACTGFVSEDAPAVAVVPPTLVVV